MEGRGGVILRNWLTVVEAWKNPKFAGQALGWRPTEELMLCFSSEGILLS